MLYYFFVLVAIVCLSLLFFFFFCFYILKKGRYNLMCAQFGYGTVYPYVLFMQAPPNMSVLSNDFFNITQLLLYLYNYHSFFFLFFFHTLLFFVVRFHLMLKKELIYQKCQKQRLKIYFRFRTPKGFRMLHMMTTSCALLSLPLNTAAL